VTALSVRSPAGGPPPALLGKQAALDLRPKEAPAGFRKSSGEYFTNAEIAVERNETVDALRQSGRLLSYQVEYRQLLDRRHPEKGEEAIDATVAAFTSASGARADFDYIRQQYSGQQFRLSTPGKYGVEDFLAVYDSSYRGKSYTNYDLLFVHGVYRAAVSVSFVKDTVPPFQALQWLEGAARAIDSRLS
jgi:hypothetical protein